MPILATTEGYAPGLVPIGGGATAYWQNPKEGVPFVAKGLRWIAVQALNDGAPVLIAIARGDGSELYSNTEAMVPSRFGLGIDARAERGDKAAIAAYRVENEKQLKALGFTPQDPTWETAEFARPGSKLADGDEETIQRKLLVNAESPAPGVKIDGIHGVQISLPGRNGFDGQFLAYVDTRTRLGVLITVAHPDRFSMMQWKALGEAILGTVLAVVAIIAGAFTFAAGGWAAIVSAIITLIKVWYDFAKTLDAISKSVGSSIEAGANQVVDPKALNFASDAGKQGDGASDKKPDTTVPAKDESEISPLMILAIGAVIVIFLMLADGD